MFLSTAFDFNQQFIKQFSVEVIFKEHTVEESRTIKVIFTAQ
jgi:hypothetical protein